MIPISNNPYIVEAVRYTTKLDYSQKATNFTSLNQDSSGNKLSKDVKNSLVSEKLNSSNFNFRYLYNVPLSRLNSTGQIFNEKEKPLAADNSNDSNNNFNDLKHLTNDSNQNGVYGYYIVDSKMTANSRDNSSRKNTNSIKKQLDKTYHSSSQNSKGSLVNIIYY